MSSQNLDMCEDYCPLLKKCVKYRLEPDEVVKLSALVDTWERNQDAMAFFSKVGRVVMKFREAAHG